MDDISIAARRITDELDTVIGWRGKQTNLVNDNITELTSNAILEWADRRQVG